jgi:hypothetical protein
MRQPERRLVDQGGDLPSRGEQAEAADYIAALTTDLALMARRHGLDTLGYILEMACLEAEAVNGRAADHQ